MTTVVGAEHLIAFGIMGKIKKNQNRISYNELHQLCQKIQTTFNDRNIDAVIVDYNFSWQVYKYQDYFRIEVQNDIPYIVCQPDVWLRDLQVRFIVSLPVDVAFAMLSCI